MPKITDLTEDTAPALTDLLVTVENPGGTPASRKVTVQKVLNLVNSASVIYTPAVATDWDSDTDPGDVDNALDQLAERVDDLEAAPPVHVHDSDDVTYTPTTLTDWDSDADPGDVEQALDQLAARVDDMEAGYVFVPLTTPLTSTAWDGDSYSTTSKTLIDLSAVFSVPAGVKAVLCKVAVADSGSSGAATGVVLSPNNSVGVGLNAWCQGLPNDTYVYEVLVVPCDANGDIYYQIYASGSGTLDIHLEIWGYWI